MLPPTFCLELENSLTIPPSRPQTTLHSTTCLLGNLEISIRHVLVNAERNTMPTALCGYYPRDEFIYAPAQEALEHKHQVMASARAMNVDAEVDGTLVSSTGPSLRMTWLTWSLRKNLPQTRRQAILKERSACWATRKVPSFQLGLGPYLGILTSPPNYLLFLGGHTHIYRSIQGHTLIPRFPS